MRSASRPRRSSATRHRDPVFELDYEPLLHAPFAQHPLWVTRYNGSEMYAGGDYPFQGQAGDGLTAYTASPENVNGQDLVVWYTLGSRTVRRSENYPVMTNDTVGFEISRTVSSTGTRPSTLQPNPDRDDRRPRCRRRRGGDPLPSPPNRPVATEGVAVERAHAGVVATTLTTARLILRDWRAEDREPFAALNADSRVMEHYPAPLTRDKSDAFIDRASVHIAEHDWGLWAIERQADARLLGSAGLWEIPWGAPFTPAVEVGWRLAFDVWGNGYATEAGAASIGRRLRPAGTRRDRVDDRAGERAITPCDGTARLTHDPADDFDHPQMPVGHPLARHVLYRIDRATWLCQPRSRVRALVRPPMRRTEFSMEELDEEVRVVGRCALTVILDPGHDQLTSRTPRMAPTVGVADQEGVPRKDGAANRTRGSRAARLLWRQHDGDWGPLSQVEHDPVSDRGGKGSRRGAPRPDRCAYLRRSMGEAG
jgi:RimJ/RimL family protein N-acetyltransferase